MKKRKKRMHLFLSEELHKKIKAAATKNNRKMTDELQERFKS